ncbi:MAG: response regulator, partial [Elainellaceae cyanobacterium]
TAPVEDNLLQNPVLGSGQCILVIDDDEAVLRSTQSLLENHGYATVAASDGAEAIAAYGQHSRDIQMVIVDIMMPTMDGLTLVRQLERMDPGLKIVAISGLAENQEAALSAGADSFLIKPYTLDNLLNQVGLLLRG